MQHNVPKQYVLVSKMYGTVWYNKVPKLEKIRNIVHYAYTQFLKPFYISSKHVIVYLGDFRPQKAVRTRARQARTSAP
jgi:ribonuclease BN (tRNA processing enzyme)